MQEKGEYDFTNGYKFYTRDSFGSSVKPALILSFYFLYLVEMGYLEANEDLFYYA